MSKKIKKSNAIGSDPICSEQKKTINFLTNFAENRLHSAAASIYGKKFFFDFMLIFDKFGLF